MRVLSLFVVVFVFFSTIEVWAGYWLAGRWYVSSRYASVSLSTVRKWMESGVITRTTHQAKIFIQRHGKWIVLTLGLSQIVKEIEGVQTSVQYCYLPSSGMIYSGWTIGGNLVINVGGDNPSRFYEVSYTPCSGGSSLYLPAVEVREWVGHRWVHVATVPASGTYTYTCGGGRQVQVVITLKVSNVCPSDVTQPPREGEVDWSQRRHIPVKVFPNVGEFLRPEVIEGDPALRWLRDEYERILADSSIPLIPSDAFYDLEIPSVDWSISPEEAVDFSSERGSTRGSDIDVPVFSLDPSFDVPEKKSFPIQLVNQLVENHPILRALQGIKIDAVGGGSCVFGSQPFVISMCDWRWVLNLMGSFLVVLSFLYGLGIGGRGD